MSVSKGFFDQLQDKKNSIPSNSKKTFIRRALVNGVLYFSIIDAVDYLMGYGDKTDANNYWRFVRSNLESEGFEVRRKSTKLKLLAEDGKRRETECFCFQDILRIIMSIPSKRVEPFKRFMAKVAEERFAEELNPDLIIDRAMEGYRKINSKEGWAEERAKGRVTRNEATRVYVEHGVRGEDIGLLTSDSHKGMTGMSVKQHKKMLGIKDTPRNHMTETELAATRLVELLGIDEIKAKDAQGTWACRKICLDAGKQVAPIWDNIQKGKLLKD